MSAEGQSSSSSISSFASGWGKRVRAVWDVFVRYFLLIALGLALLLSLSTFDSNRFAWTHWFPLPLSLIVISTLLISGEFYSRFCSRILLVLIAFVIFAAALFYKIIDSPVPWLGLADLFYLLAAFQLAIAVYLLSMRYPATVHIVFIVVLAASLALRWNMQETAAALRPDIIAIVFSIFWGFVALGGVPASMNPGSDQKLSSAVRKSKRHMSAGHRSFPRLTLVGAHLLALLVGAIVALTCHKVAWALMGEAGDRIPPTMEVLWSQSVLFGWGRAHLVQVLGRALSVGGALPLWLGLEGTLAAHGFLFVLLMIAVTLFILRSAFRMRRRFHQSPTSAPQLAFVSAQAMISFIVFGGPNSAIPYLIAILWFALGFAIPLRTQVLAGLDLGETSGSGKLVRGVTSWSAASIVGLVSLVGFIFCYSQALLIEAESNDRSSIEVRRTLNRAKFLNRWEPRIDYAVAQSLLGEMESARRSVTARPARIREALRRAMTLDPSEPKYVKGLAEFEMSQGRFDEAFRVAERSLLLNSGSEQWINWIFETAERADRFDVADRMIDHALRLRPDSSLWHRRSYFAERRVGLSSRSVRMMGVALTGAFGETRAEEAMVGASFDYRR